MVRELKANEFTAEAVLPIIKSVFDRVPFDRSLNDAHFLKTWQAWMKLGFARTWSNDTSILGGIVTPNIFSGDSVFSVVFWFSQPGANASVLLKTAEQSVKDAGCIAIDSAAYKISRGDPMKRMYRIRGYKEVETVFRKML